jgi:hypothetical protein
MGAHGASEVDASTATPPASSTSTVSEPEPEYKVDESDDDEDDTIPDDGYADGGEPYTDEEMEEIRKEKKSKNEEKVEEGKQTCNECGGLMEDNHECEGQLNEWSNSPQGQSEDEQFESDMAFMTKVLAGGLNKEKRDQTTLPHTQVKVSEGYNIDVAAEMRKLAGIR